MKYKTRHPLYSVWCNLRRRCNEPTNKAYRHYGGRGIRVCDRWLTSFEHFAADMGERPDGLSIDRIDVNGDYTPENCRWATHTEQMRNSQKPRLMIVDGVEYHVAELAEKTGIPALTLFQRYQKGWPKEKVFAETPQWNNVESQKKAILASTKKKNDMTQCKRGHQLSGDNLYLIKTAPGGEIRRCRICARARDRRAYHGYIHPVEYYLKD